MAEGDQTAVAASPGGSAESAGAATAAPTQEPDNGDAQLSPMELELEMVTTERDDYRRKLEAVEAELAALTAASPNVDTINKLQQDNDHLRKTLKKATDMLREKITSCNMQEKKNQALTQQVSTLKDVLQVTRDLLNIRNMEVEQLQKNVDSMESRIDDNRRRQTAMIKQMEQATKINGDLRNEYETQLRLFQSLKERYEEKVTKLTSLAIQGQRHNSEGSDHFEDAADSADRTEVVNTTDKNSAEAGTVAETSDFAENSNISAKDVGKVASETNNPEIETTNASDIIATEIKIPQTSTSETIVPDIATTDGLNTPEISQLGKLDAQETSAPKTSDSQ
ncbi:Uncharacterized protein GBIM_12736 [Gryllus bimaculatus]|nr:Uncharacterized protein GBIM_12736 [Gryllus bimaculatus]